MAGTWKPLTHQPRFNTSTMIQLTDGRVMVQEEGAAHWHALTPDPHGSYLDGTWSSLADMSIWRRYYVSAILGDGRVLVIGGEQSGGGNDTNKGEIYDPVADAWSPMPSPPGWAQVGDASSCLLPDGRLIISALLNGDCVIYDHASNSWLPAGTMSGRANEETWILLGDDTIITAQTFKPFGSERYSMSSNVWKSAGALPVQVVDPPCRGGLRRDQAREAKPRREGAQATGSRPRRESEAARQGTPNQGLIRRFEPLGGANGLLEPVDECEQLLALPDAAPFTFVQLL
jgi:hypothetical protein